MIVKFICKKDWHGIGDYYYGKIYNGYPCEKEQKGYDIYDDNHVPTFCDEDFINEYFNIVTEEKQDEPKSDEWSEEDEKIFGRICALIHSAAYKNYDIDEDGNECGEYANIKEWFKKLKDRVQLQNITITDEELVQAKKDAYNDALDKIEYHSGEPTFDDGWSAAIWYLKKRNAQPQNRWKPSNEQIKVCKEVYADILSAKGFDLGTVNSELNRMEEQLKKLRDE